ncbi:hypothetical protein BJY00DRAFT_308865 [Aspergillus carlsbadensis]|nr:hypothetical protein BJY00DRAFT_308865 [Aspergillus carlsbadensis]
MASLFESDFRTSSYFPMYQAPDEKEMHHITSPYCLLQGDGGDPASYYPPYFPQATFMSSLQHVTNEYDYFVKGVVSDVLLRVEEQASTAATTAVPTPYSTPPPQLQPPQPPQPPQPQPQLEPRGAENIDLPTQYHTLSDDTGNCDDPSLMWGSDLSFGPNGFRPLPNSPQSPPIDTELVYIYTKSLVPLSHQPQQLHPTHASRPLSESTPYPDAHSTPRSQSLSPSPSPTHIKRDDLPTSDVSELNRGGIQKITGKKRRRLLHIIAERNRRLNQNKMYEELYRLVPGLENSARSTKREVLTKTADWLEDLVEENTRLEEQLRMLKASPSGPGPGQHSGTGQGDGRG